jgi:hypothetical protein
MINWKGICVFAVILLAGCGNDRDTSEEPRLSGESLSRFATLASDCITVEYPNKLSQVLWDERSLRAPRPDLPGREEISAGVFTSLDPENIAGEVAYFETASKSWERAYGWAWLLQLATELNTWDDPLGKKLASDLAPPDAGHSGSIHRVPATTGIPGTYRRAPEHRIRSVVCL